MFAGNPVLPGAARSRVFKLNLPSEIGNFRNLQFNSRSSGQQSRGGRLPIIAFGPDPYAPLEKAIQVINRVLDSAQRKEQPGKPRKERWVQFGAQASAKATLAQLTPSGADLDYDATAALLEQYLSLPVDQYSLLDPEWVCREEGSDNSFRLSIPLSDMLGVDMRPEVSITSHPNPGAGRVTLVGSRAVLGSPALDDTFKLKLVAELRCKRRRRRLPDHIPGRPVYRMRRWAAKARGREWHEESAGACGIAVLAAAPLPSEKVYISMEEPPDRDSDDEEEDEVVGSSGSEEEAVLVIGELAGAETSGPSPVAVSSRALLDFSVNVTMAVRVPGPLRVVPNALLGYAGSVVAKTVLNAALPNFLTLLSSDFQVWVKAGGKRATGAAVDEDGALPAPDGVTGLFTVGASSSGIGNGRINGRGGSAESVVVVVAESEVVVTSP